MTNKFSLEKSLSIVENNTKRFFQEYIIGNSNIRFSFDDIENAFPLFLCFFGNRIISKKQLSLALDKISCMQNKTVKNTKTLKLSEYVRRLGLIALFYEEIRIYCQIILKHIELEKAIYSDERIRNLGIGLLDNSLSGFIIVPKKTKDKSLADNIIRRNLFYNDNIYRTVQCLVRISLMFGCKNKINRQSVINYCAQNIPAATVLFGDAKPEYIAQALGGLNFSLAVIANKNLASVKYIKAKDGFDNVVFFKNNDEIIDKAIETRNIRINPDLSRFPVGFSDTFQGQIIKDKDLLIDFPVGSTCELLVDKPSSFVHDGKIELIGHELDKIVYNDKNNRFFILLEVAFKNETSRFNAVLERQIHRFINYIDGVSHRGQKDFFSLSISKDAFRKGLRLKDIAFFIYAMLHKEYHSIVSKVQIKIVTDKKEFEKQLKKTKVIYSSRLLKSFKLTDTYVKEFYSCSICSSFVLNHACIITPEHPGLCGSYSFDDARIAFRIDPSGASRPIKKGKIISRRLGQWQGINEFVAKTSKEKIKNINLYSIMQSPHTCSACFECIVLVLPEVNAVMAVSRDYNGNTPMGLGFTELAELFEYDKQSPGMICSSRIFLLSKKFIAAEGGLDRVVWMNSSLKQFLLKHNGFYFKNDQLKNSLRKIADEHNCITLKGLGEFISRVKHPCLGMKNII